MVVAITDFIFLFNPFVVQTVEIMVKMDCDGYEKRVHNSVSNKS